ncbi:MAG: exonuclease subunit SbcD, partial [Pseudomonadota bacterium]
MLRVLHTADWHLGQQLHGFDRASEHDAALNALLDIAEARAPDALLLAGDVFHHANPPLGALRRFFGFIHALRARAPGAHLIAIAGNHDSGARL